LGDHFDDDLPILYVQRIDLDAITQVRIGDIDQLTILIDYHVQGIERAAPTRVGNQDYRGGWFSIQLTESHVVGERYAGLSR
jgi:hypothetical protein